MGKFQIFDGDVTSPKGFLASGIHCGIKKYKRDMALILSDVVGVGAAVFTTNKACAAPVVVSKENLKSGIMQGIIINSGNANACTGIKGLNDAKEMVVNAAEALNLPMESILVSSTGVIGVPLPMDKINQGINMAIKELSYDGGKEAAEAIMTTDTRMKNISVVFEIDGKEVTLGGIAKGSGMIHPNMATMLSFITSDINIEGEFLQKVLTDTADNTYNMISVDGDTSTNDMVAVMANGLAENSIMNENHPQVDIFLEAFYYINEYLAKTIVRDGEGATKFLEVEATGFLNDREAKKVVKAVLNSPLVKTAFFGEDGNWGRIVCSVGYSGAEMYIEKLEVTLKSQWGAIKIVENGQGANYLEEEMSMLLKHQDITILINGNSGNGVAKGWGCDLSYDYVKINGSYRS